MRHRLAVAMFVGCLFGVSASSASATVQPVTLWSAEDNAEDGSGTHDGVLVNNVTFVNGLVGRAFSFSQGAHVMVPDDPAWTLGSDPFSIVLWARFNGPCPDSMPQAFIASDNGPGTQDKWIFFHDGNLTFHTVVVGGAGTGYPVTFPWNPIAGVWYHLAVTRSGDDFTLYINGSAVAINNFPVVIPDATTPLTIGLAEGQFGFNGLIDEVALYDQALAPADVLSLYGAASPPPADRIAGTVMRADGAPLGGVAVTLGGNASSAAITDACGQYVFDSLAAGGSYTVTPAYADYDFTPAMATIGNLSGTQYADFVGQAILDLSVSIQGPANGTTGFPVAYTVPVVNAGPETAPYTLSVVFSSSVVLQSAAGGDGCTLDQSNTEVTCPFYGNPGTETFHIEVLPQATGTLDAVVSVTAPISDPDVGNNSASLSTVVGSPAVPTGTSCVPPPANLTVWYTAEGDARDVVGGHDGTLHDGATFAPGMVGQAFSLDGQSAFIDAPYSEAWNYGANPFTIALWARFDDPGRSPAHQTFLASGAGGGGGQRNWIFWHTPGSFSFLNENPDPGVPGFGLDYGWVPPANEWHHFVITREGALYTLYIDGVARVTATDPNTSPIANAMTTLTIGEWEANFFDGLLDEISIFSRALSPSEVWSIFDAGSHGQCRTVAFTQSGANIGVDIAGTALTFPSVTAGGTTNVVPDASIAANYSLPNNLGAYEIHTTASYDTSGYEGSNCTTNGVQVPCWEKHGIKVGFSVPSVNDPAVFNNLVIAHGEVVNQTLQMVPYDGAAGTARATYHDFASRRVWIYVSSLSPFAVVKSIRDQIADLVSLVGSLNLQQGIQNSLDAKLDRAYTARNAAIQHQYSTVCQALNAFRNEVNAQTGHAITQLQGGALLAASAQAMWLTRCQ